MKKVQFEGYEIYTIHEQKHESKWGAIKENQYSIYVKNIRTGNKLMFRYWSGNTVYRPMKTNYDLIFSLQSFLGDALCAQETFEEFCDEFGYELYDDEEYGYNRKALEIHRACKREYEKALYVFENEEEITRVYNKTIDLENGDYELDKENIV